MKTVNRYLSLILAMVMIFTICPVNIFANDYSDSLSNFEKDYDYDTDLFNDVESDEWYYENVKAAYELGLMRGVGNDTFNPNGTISIAEAITIAARIHSIYFNGDDSFEQGNLWYEVYVDYAYSNGIINNYYADYSMPAIRGLFAMILCSALPDEALNEINRVSDNMIPDVMVSDPFADSVYKLYRAGIMIGSDNNGTFMPNSEITRCEVAAIVTRMVDRSLRKSIDLSREYTVEFDLGYDNLKLGTQFVSEGDTIQKPVDPKRVGYDFAGWYTKKDGGEMFNFSQGIYDDITLYAHWNVDFDWLNRIINDGYNIIPELERIICTVTFDGNAEDAENVPDPQKVIIGTHISEPVSPERKGYSFAGWFIDKSLTVEYDFSTPVYKSFTLYAKWISDNNIIEIDTGDYDEYTVNRAISINVDPGITINEITYEQKGEHKDESDNIEVNESNEITLDILLENGDNLITIKVTDANGNVYSETVTLKYESGDIYSNTDVVGENNENLIFTPLCFDDADTEPYEYLISNILCIYFNDSTSFEERVDFIENTLGGTVVGSINAINMVQMFMTETIPNAENVGYYGETDLTIVTEEDLQAYADSIEAAYPDLVDLVCLDYAFPEIPFDLETNDTWNGNLSGSYDDDDWYLKVIDAYEAWEYDDYHNSDYLTNITVGIVDNGFNIKHAELNGIIDFVSDTKTVDEHGTGVAGVIGAKANNGIGIAGVMHNNVKIKAYSSDSTESDILNGLVKTVEAGAKVVNFSLGFSQFVPANIYELSQNDRDRHGKKYSKALAELLNDGQDFIVVQSAGNGNNGGIGVDYWHNGVFASINDSNCYSNKRINKEEIMNRIMIVSNIINNESGEYQITLSSNGGSGELNIIAAPGEKILTTVTGQSFTSYGITYNDWNEYWRDPSRNKTDWITSDTTYAYQKGTSFAAPIVTAVCALTWSVNPELTGIDVTEYVMDTVEGTANSSWAGAQTHGGMGIVNAKNAVERAIETVPVYCRLIKDKYTGKAIDASAVVYSASGEIVGEEGVYYTDNDGFIDFPRLPYGSYKIKVSANGYRSKTVDVEINKYYGSSTSTAIELEPISFTVTHGEDNILSMENLEMYNGLAEQTWTVTSSSDWTVTSDSDWFTLNKSSGKEGTETLKINISDGTDDYREGEITFTVDGSEYSVKIYQKAYAFKGNIKGNGSYIENATVTVYNEYTSKSAQTDSNGYFCCNVPNAYYFIKINADGYDEKTLETDYLMNGSDVVLGDINLDAKAIEVKGIILDSTGSGIGGVTATVYNSDGVQIGSPVTSSDDGAYSFSFVSFGTYKIVYSKTGYNTETVEVFTVDAATEAFDSVTMREAEVVEPYTVTGKVVDSVTGEPIVGAAVGTSIYSYGTDKTVYTDENGQFSIVTGYNALLDMDNVLIQITNSEYVVYATLVVPQKDVVTNMGTVSLKPSDKTVEENYLVAEGRCGDTLYWTLTTRNNPYTTDYTTVFGATLRIFGSGDMWNGCNVMWEFYNYDNDYFTSTKGISLGMYGNIIIEEGVKSLGVNMLSGIGIREIHLPKSLESLSYNRQGSPFGDNSLNSITVDENNPYFTSDKGVLYNKDMTELIACPAYISHTVQYDHLPGWNLGVDIEHLNIPDTVKKISDFAFFYNWNVHTLTIPDSVTEIGERAFAGSNLVAIEMPDSITKVGFDVFGNCEDLVYVKLSENLTAITSMFYGCDALESIVIPSKLTNLNIAFSNCANLKKIYFKGDFYPLNLSGAFSGCSSDLTLYYLEGKQGWTTPTVTDSRGETYNTAVYSLDEIDNYVISSGTAGGDITWEIYSDGTLYVNGSGVMNNSSYNNGNPDQSMFGSGACFVKKAIIEDGITSIGNYAFQDCYNMKTVDIPDTVNIIGNRAFSGCDSLLEITIPEGVETLGEYTFSSVSLTKVILPSTLKTIGNNAFYGCYSLKNINFPENLTTIGNAAFCYAPLTESVVFPASLTSIGNNVFNYCIVSDYYFMGDAPTLGTDAFGYTNEDITLHYIPGKNGWTSPTWVGSNGTEYNTQVFDEGSISLSGNSSNVYSISGCRNHFLISFNFIYLPKLHT